MRLKHLFFLLLLPLFVLLTANKTAEKMPSKEVIKPSFVERFLIKKIEKKLPKSLIQQDSTLANALTEEVKKGKEAVNSGSLGLVSLLLGIVIGLATQSGLVIVLGLCLAVIFALVALSKSGISKTKEARSGRCLGIGILIVAGLIAYWIYSTINSG
jgi:FtsH-binding integral membrane protein